MSRKTLQRRNQSYIAENFESLHDVASPSKALQRRAQSYTTYDIELQDNSPSDVEELVNGNAAPEKYPEGGLRAWLVVLGAMCCGMTGFGLLNCTGVLLEWLQTHQLQNYSPGDVGWIFSVSVFLLFAAGTAIGPVFDRFGPRVVVLVGSITTVVSLFLAAESSQYWQVMLSFVMFGLGAGALFTPSIAAIGHWFLIRRGFATGIGITGGSFGGILYPLILSHTLPTYGYAWSLRILGFIFVFLLIFANLLIKSRLPPLPGQKASMDFRAFKELPFTLTTVAMFLCELALFLPITYLTLYATQHGLDQSKSTYLLSILNVGSLFGRALPGYFADRFGPFNCLSVLLLLTALTTIAMWLPANNSEPVIMIYAFVFGVGSGSAISMTPVAISKICRTEQLGSRTGLSYGVVSIGSLIGVPIGGAILQLWQGSFTGLIIFTASIFLASSLMFGGVRLLVTGMHLKVAF